MLKRRTDLVHTPHSSLPGPNPLSAFKPMPDPTPEQIEDPLFLAIWQTIKSWDVNVPEHYFGYCGANGSHVMLIWNAIKEMEKEDNDGTRNINR